MQTTLMNFGDNSRVVSDINNGAILIGIGEIVECDIHDVHFNMIRRAIATETLMAVPKDVRPTPKLKSIMELLRGLEVLPYDELLQKFFEVLPPPGVEEGAYRPTRGMIRIALGEASRLEVAAALKLQSRVVIHEQGDKVTRQEVPPPTKPEVIDKSKEPKPDTNAPGKPIKTKTGFLKDDAVDGDIYHDETSGTDWKRENGAWVELETVVRPKRQAGPKATAKVQREKLDAKTSAKPKIKRERL